MVGNAYGGSYKGNQLLISHIQEHNFEEAAHTLVLIASLSAEYLNAINAHEKISTGFPDYKPLYLDKHLFAAVSLNVFKEIGLDTSSLVTNDLFFLLIVLGRRNDFFSSLFRKWTHFSP